MAAQAKQDVKLLSGGTMVLLLFIAVGAVAAVMRLTRGLGAATNLNDSFPWGLWIAFDVMAGVALAAGGFTITAAVYIFGMEKYKPIAKPAVLTAFVGYLMVMLGLFLDIGKPTSFYHPIYMWQKTSVLFEVVWCVLLYSAVLFFENISKSRGALLALVIAGITLSFGHQSSLGGLFLLSGSKLSPLYWSPWMSYLFFLSAIAAGLAMVSIETIWSHRAFKMKQDREIVAGLARGTAVALAVYIVLRFSAIAANGAVDRIFAGDMASVIFLVEMVLFTIMPMLLLFLPSVQQSVDNVMACQMAVVTGVIVNRFAVALLTQGAGGQGYFPSWIEFAVTLGLISLGIFLYRFAVVTWPILSHAKAE